MGNENRGKQFEDQIKQAFESMPETSIIRLIDPQNGYAGVRNICDFVAYNYPLEYLIECKSCHGSSLSIHSNDPKHRYGAITNNQWEGLLEHSKKGIISGYMIWFIDKDLTVFVPAKYMKKLRDDGLKSFNPSKINPIMYYVIEGKKKRVLFDYDLTSFMKTMEMEVEVLYGSTALR